MSLSADAADLLLRLLEARELLYTRSTVVGGRGAAAGSELIDNGLLVPAGFTNFVVDDTADDPEFVEVAMDHERGELGYHSRFRGWMKVERQELQRYRPSVEAIVQSLFGNELRRPMKGLVEIEPGLIWEVGQLRLMKTGWTTIWLARRLGERPVEDRLLAANICQPATGRRVILLSTPRERLRPGLHLDGSTIIPLQNVLTAYKPLSIDMTLLRVRFAGKSSPPVTEPLHLSDDASVLTIMGTPIPFTGAAQQKAIRIMVEAHQAGRGVNAATTLADAGFGPSIRTWRQAFRKQWPLLEPYLKSRNRLWSFEL